MPKGFAMWSSRTCQTYTLSLSWVKDTQMKIQHPTSPVVSGRPPKSPRPRALRPPPSGLLPPEVLLLSFSLATKPDLCCQNSALSVVRVALLAFLSSHCSQITGHSKPSPDYSLTPPTTPLSILQAVDMATQNSSWSPNMPCPF